MMIFSGVLQKTFELPTSLVRTCKRDLHQFMYREKQVQFLSIS